jgi:DNA-binding transcriptional ArsR family regulator
VSASGDVLDRTYRALADPTRRGMLDRLVDGPAPVSELAAPLAMTLAAALQHVQVLETSGLIATQKQGRIRSCRLNPEALQAAEQWLADRRSVWERRLDRLGAVLDEQASQPSDHPKGRP